MQLANAPVKKPDGRKQNAVRAVGVTHNAVKHLYTCEIGVSLQMRI
jgi:hypothetical protein